MKNRIGLTIVAVIGALAIAACRRGTEPPNIDKQTTAQVTETSAPDEGEHLPAPLPEAPGGGIIVQKNVMVPMRDGVRLATDIYRPAGSEKYPVVLARTPYGNELPHVTKQALFAKTLARDRVPVMLDPLQDLPSDFDRLGARLDNAARLHDAGVRIAFSGIASMVSVSHSARIIRQLAGNAVAHGLPWDTALAAITANPAEIFGLGATRGRIAVGQVADLVLWSGDPLEVTALADQVWIAGRAVEMRSRQTELRDRYLKH